MEISSNSVESQENIFITISNDNDDNVIVKFNRQSAGGNIQSSPTRNLYASYFGPTLDETLPVGYETFRNVYCCCDCDIINPDEGSHRSKHSVDVKRVCVCCPKEKMQSKNKPASTFAMKSSYNVDKPSTFSMKPQNGSYYSNNTMLVPGGNTATISASKMSQYSSGKGLKKTKKPPTNFKKMSNERTQTAETISLDTSELEVPLTKIRKSSDAKTQTAKKTQRQGKRQSEDTTQTEEKIQTKERIPFNTSEMQENYYSPEIKKLSNENTQREGIRQSEDTTQTEERIPLNTSEMQESNRSKHTVEKKDKCTCCPKDRKKTKRKAATSPKKPYYSPDIRKVSNEKSQTEDRLSLSTSEVEVYQTNYETQPPPSKHFESVTRQFYISSTQVKAKDSSLDIHHDSQRKEPCNIWPPCNKDVCTCTETRHRSGGRNKKLKAPCGELKLPGIGGYTMFERMLSKCRQRRRNHELYKTSLEMWTAGKCCMFCTNCRRNVKPLMKTKKNKIAYSSFAAALLISCWPICFLCQDNCVMELYCPYCRLKLSIYNPKSNCCRR